MSQNIILPNRREVADLNEAVRSSAQRQDSMQLNRYWSEPVTRAELQKVAGHMINEALQGFLVFVGENFELQAITPTGEQILAEIRQLKADKHSPDDAERRPEGNGNGET